ncbi:hypothetical protein SOVF_178620 [Spinacia oleracea]|nr:hypothetical protein SOVF_178620 [Spinacia oleracea]
MYCYASHVLCFLCCILISLGTVLLVLYSDIFGYCVSVLPRCILI